MFFQWLALATALPAYCETPSAFDPSAYLNKKEVEASAAAHTGLTGRAIYRIDGRRFQKFSANTGAVLLPSTDSVPELLDEFAVCEQHLRLFKEVIPLRYNVPLDTKIKKDEVAILALIEKCRTGSIKGPKLVVDNPDGSTTEIQAKKPKQQARDRPTND